MVETIDNKKLIDITEKRKRPFDTILLFLIYSSIVGTVFLLLFIIGTVTIKGLPEVSWGFLTTKQSILYDRIGVLPNIINTIYLVLITLIIATPIGIGSAIYLNEYAKQGKLVNIIVFTTETLAGIPSIIYGLFGFVFFGIALGLKYSILNGALTLAIMVLPIIIRTTQETLKTVPSSYKEGAFGLGAKKWYIIRTIILPYSLPGIITGVILAVGRIIAESAALIFTAGIAENMVQNVFTHMFNSGGSLTVQLYQFANLGKNGPAFGIAFILVLVILIINILIKLITKIFNKEGRR